MKYFFAILCLSMVVFGVVSCNKCYNCTKKCGSCSKPGFPTVAGCDGDSILGPYTTDTWKAYLEGQGYTCVYDNAVVNDICGTDNKNTYQNQHYTCVTK